ncbi:hypothetical protein [Haloactinomyces albus]|uniref:Uncharacterized protein n=1 Tax=Haloactinomyces albus TaxID=1352928 RepID=A0AAE3ZAR6_9ACTN|nr:hypothetical protein [Haloactinomyces albus]MDR7301458.1 hypothetical protein [Haloactinomyces albus]
MAEETELELLITVVVAAAGDHAAREACRELVRRVGGRIVESGDCSDEEPGCWSVTLLCRGGEADHRVSAAALSRAVRNFLRELGPGYGNSRVSCEPPTAWTVVDNPELVGKLVDGGERLLVEAWPGDSPLPMSPGQPSPPSGTRISSDPARSADPEAIGDPDESIPAESAEPRLDDLDENGRPRVRLGLVVDVLSQRQSGAEWPARALASRVSHTITVTGSTEHPPVVRVVLDLGPFVGTVSELVPWAVTEFGGRGWSPPQAHARGSVARWSTASAPRSGITAIELFAFEPESGTTDPARATAAVAATVASASDIPG